MNGKNYAILPKILIKTAAFFLFQQPIIQLKLNQTF